MHCIAALSPCPRHTPIQRARKPWFSPSCHQAYWRGAKAAAGLRRWEECRYLCEEGLRLDADNADLARLRQRCSDEERTDAQRAEEEKRRAAEKRAPARHLATAMLEKGWRVGRPQFSVGEPVLGHREMWALRSVCLGRAG